MNSEDDSRQINELPSVDKTRTTGPFARFSRPDSLRQVSGRREFAFIERIGFAAPYPNVGRGIASRVEQNAEMHANRPPRWNRARRRWDWM